MNKKTFVIAALVLGVGIIGAILWRNSKEVGASKTISVGVIIPLTGDYAKIGTDIKKSIEVAEADAIQRGLIKQGQIQILFEDNKLDANNTVAAYNKLRSINNIQAVITVTSQSILALKPLVNKDKVLLLNASAISTDIEDSADFCFSLIPNAKAESEYLSNFILQDKGIRSLALIYRNDPSGQSFNRWFSQKYTSDGGVINVTEAHPANTSDFRTIIAKLRSGERIGGIFMASLGVETANFVKQSRELNLNIPVFTYESINQPKAIEVAGETIDNIEFVTPRFNPNDASFNVFKRSLAERYKNDEINFYMISHYNAFMLIIKLVNSGFNSGNDFKDNIPRLGAVNFLGSEISIDPQGNASTALEISGFKNKQVVTVKQ